MGCSTSKPQKKEEPVPWDAPKPKAKLRKQLTLSDLEDTDAATAEGQEPLSEAINPKRKADGASAKSLKRSFSCSSVTDRKGKANFSEKTAATTDNDINPEEFGIYVTCRKGTKPGSPPNQDSWYVRKDDGFAVYGVFDGHGRHGHDVSNFVKRHLPPLMENDTRFRGPQQHLAVIEAFDKVTRLIQNAAENNELDCARSGTTATIAIHDPEKELLITAHVGDSGAALARGPQQKAQYLTPDHKPNLPGEMKRIKASGGSIDFDGYNYRVYKTGEGYPGLNMSRAFGDLLGRTAGIISAPDMNQVKLSTGDRYLLLCSDGVWEWILPQEAFDICHKALMSGGNPAKELAFAASNAWVENAEDVIDDITIVFVDLANTGGEACKHEPVKKAKGILKRSKTTDSIGTFNSEITTASQKSGSNASGLAAVMNPVKQDPSSLTSEQSTASSEKHSHDPGCEKPSVGGDANGHADSMLDTPAILAESFSEDDKGLDGIPAARGPDKPMKTPLLPFRALYVSSKATPQS